MEPRDLKERVGKIRPRSQMRPSAVFHVHYLLKKEMASYIHLTLSFISVAQRSFQNVCLILLMAPSSHSVARDSLQSFSGLERNALLFLHFKVFRNRGSSLCTGSLETPVFSVPLANREVWSPLNCLLLSSSVGDCLLQ